MPSFCFPLPNFLRFHRSRHSHSLELTSVGPPHDAAAPRPMCHDSSPVLPSFHSSGHIAVEQEVLTATNIPRSAPPTHPQNSTGHICADMAPKDSSGQSSRVLQPITQMDVVDSRSVPMPYYDLAAQQPAYLTRLPVPVDHAHLQQSSVPQTSYSFTTPSQQPPLPELRGPLDVLQPYKPGFFHQAENFSATGNFINGNVGNAIVYITPPSNKFMEKLLKETIPGATSDSSARHPPPRCHPGTRLTILERCFNFIVHRNGDKKMCWVVGAAGVGKSAIMQNVAESSNLPVTFSTSVFFSINGRNDGTKAIMTLSYQFAVKSKLYRRFIEDEITNDPSLLRSSMPVQFQKFIIQPFIHNPHLNSAGRILIIIDGLDECRSTDTQVELLQLISNLCISYPSSPIVWFIASRPETHITSFFSRAEVIPVLEKEEIPIDSDEAHADVERFLRDELTELGKASDLLDPHWPDEQHLWKLAEAAGGLFAYAHTVVRYIGDSTIGDPTSQLSDVINVINEHSMHDIPREQHPMALLYALYARILSNVPPRIMINTRKLLLLLASNWDMALGYSKAGHNFVVLCNWLGMTPDEAYAAVKRLRSVLRFPQWEEAHEEAPKPFHKSLVDFISSSGFSPDTKLEARQIMTQCAFRVLQEAPDGVDFGDGDYDSHYGVIARVGGTNCKIPITWPVKEEIDWDDDRTRLNMYKLAIGEVVDGIDRGDPLFQSEFCIGLLISRFQEYKPGFPRHQLRELVFNQSRYHEFIMCGILKRIPVKAADLSKSYTYHTINLRFRGSATLWNSSCKHKRDGQYEQGKEQDWTTAFRPGRCTYCFERLERQLESWVIRHPDQTVPIFFTSAGPCCVELQFVDPEDDVSEWTYSFWIDMSLEERKKYGSIV